MIKARKNGAIKILESGEHLIYKYLTRKNPFKVTLKSWSLTAGISFMSIPKYFLFDFKNFELNQ